MASCDDSVGLPVCFRFDMGDGELIVQIFQSRRAEALEQAVASSAEPAAMSATLPSRVWYGFL